MTESDDISRIIETLKMGGTIDADDAVIYGQHVSNGVRAATIEECAKVADNYARNARYQKEIPQAEDIEMVAKAIRSLSTGGEGK